MKRSLLVSLLFLVALPTISPAGTQAKNTDEVIVTTSLELIR